MADPTVVSISPGQTSADNRQDSPVAQLYAPPAGPAPHDAGNGSSPSSSASSSTAASIKKLTRSNTLSDHGTAAIDKKYEAKRAAVDSWYHRRCDRIEQNYQDEDSEKRQAEQQKLEARHAAKLERAAIKYNKRLSKAEEKARKQSYKQINSRKSSYTAGPDMDDKPRRKSLKDRIRDSNAFATPSTTSHRSSSVGGGVTAAMPAVYASTGRGMGVANSASGFGGGCSGGDGGASAAGCSGGDGGGGCGGGVGGC